VCSGQKWSAASCPGSTTAGPVRRATQSLPASHASRGDAGPRSNRKCTTPGPHSHSQSHSHSSGRLPSPRLPGLRRPSNRRPNVPGDGVAVAVAAMTAWAGRLAPPGPLGLCRTSGSAAARDEHPPEGRTPKNIIQASSNCDSPIRVVLRHFGCSHVCYCRPGYPAQTRARTCPDRPTAGRRPASRYDVPRLVGPRLSPRSALLAACVESVSSDRCKIPQIASGKC